MPDYPEESIRAILNDLKQASPHITAAAVVALSGLSIVSIMPTYVEEERVSAMSAVMLLLGKRMTGALRSGQLDKIYIKGETGHIILMYVGQDAVLIMLAGEGAVLGLLLLEMQLAVAQLKELLAACP